MKKFLVIISFLFITLIGNSQTVTHQGWRLVNGGEWNSFYWCVTRTQNADYSGKYYYYIYFYSNSYFNTKLVDGYNYDKASTYIRNINVTMGEYKPDSYGNLSYYNSVNINMPFYTCDWVHNTSNYGAWFWSYRPHNDFKMTFSKASAFDYSIY